MVTQLVVPGRAQPGLLPQAVRRSQEPGARSAPDTTPVAELGNSTGQLE